MNHMVKVLCWLTVAVATSACSLVSEPSGGATALPVAKEGPHVATVHITGLPGEEVAVRLGLFDDSAHWLRQSRVFKARLVLSDRSEARVSFYGMPPGTYAIAAYIDRNDNARLDRWFGFLPKEPVAFSKVAHFRLPPSFSDSAFNVPTSEVIELHFK